MWHNYKMDIIKYIMHESVMKYKMRSIMECIMDNCHGQRNMYKVRD